MSEYGTAIVESVQQGPPPTVTVRTVEDVFGCRYLRSYSPVIGDVVTWTRYGSITVVWGTKWFVNREVAPHTTP